MILGKVKICQEKRKQIWEKKTYFWEGTIRNIFLGKGTSGIRRQRQKQRLESISEEGAWLDRAVQGHSIEAVIDDELLRKYKLEDPDLPAFVIHGTYVIAWESIRKLESDRQEKHT